MRFIYQEVLPLVRRAFPDVRLLLAGGSPPAEIRRMTAGTPGVEITGYVSDLCPYIASGDVYLCGLQTGTGIKNRVLEALAMGKPTISTSVGVEGTDLRHGEHLLVADAPTEFAEAVVKLLQDPPFGRRLGAGGRRAVQERYSWHKVGQQVMTLYEEVTGLHTEGTPAGAISSSG